MITLLSYLWEKVTFLSLFRPAAKAVVALVEKSSSFSSNVPAVADLAPPSHQSWEQFSGHSNQASRLQPTESGWFFLILHFFAPFSVASAEPGHTLDNHPSIRPLSSSGGGGQHSTSRQKTGFVPSRLAPPSPSVIGKIGRGRKIWFVSAVDTEARAGNVSGGTTGEQTADGLSPPPLRCRTRNRSSPGTATDSSSPCRSSRGAAASFTTSPCSPHRWGATIVFVLYFSEGWSPRGRKSRNWIHYSGRRTGCRAVPCR